ncbi:MAG TPA: histidine kinase [Candidatus Tenderia electrophaga]|uniref:Histidine kinase n=1 Tax=Candidatus Tenderia electrophaga TaxID=1748243 RepID=A0A832J5R1_9GAMM|nr:histidine kinase [Candidatus Tenderia electrophaga]
MTHTEFIYQNPVDMDESRALLSAWKSSFPNAGVLALFSETDKDHIPALQKICRNAQLPLIGAIFPELIFDSQFRSNGAILIRIDSMPAHLLIENLSGPQQKLDEIATRFSSTFEYQPDSTLFMIFDGMLPNIGTFLDTLFRHTTGEFHFCGVNAGSETFQPTPCLFDNQRLVGNAVIAMQLPNHPGAVIEHNYNVPEHTFIATATDSNRISSIDWQPAFEAYAKLIKDHYNVEITKDNFYQHSVHFPFGITRADGQTLVRIPVALNDDGSLFCVGEIPENSLLTILQAIQPGSTETVDQIKKQTPKQNNNIGLGFYCAGRRMHLKNSAADELKYWQEQFLPTAIIGALTLGEIGSSLQGGYPLFHNATLVYTPWIKQ